MSELSAFSRGLLASGKGSAVPPAAKAKALAKVAEALRAPIPGVSTGVIAGGAAAAIAIAIAVVVTATRPAPSAARARDKDAPTLVEEPRVEARASSASASAPRWAPATVASVSATPRKADVGPQTAWCEEAKIAETRSVCSVEKTHIPINVEWINTCGSETIDVFSLDKNCNEQWYRTLKPGETKRSFIFAAFGFRIREHDSKRLLKEVVVDRSVATGADWEDYETHFVARLPDIVVTETSRAVATPRASGGGYKAKLRIVNQRTSEVDVHWVDHDGREGAPHRLEAGATKEIDSVETYLWRVRDPKTGELLAESSFYPDRNVDDEILENTLFVTVP